MAELQRRMSSREFAEWIAFYGMEPFGDSRGDLQAAIVASTMANTARDPKKRSKPFKPEDFIPRFEVEEKDEPDWQVMLQQVVMMNAAFGGRDLRQTNGNTGDAGGEDSV